ncbi:MAG: glycosyltransferase family 9 protein [Bacteroidota bacterium]
MDKRGSHTHVLVIRLSAMGDVAMTVPVLQSITATYPLLKVTVLTKKTFAPIFKGLGNVTVVVADVKKRHKGLIGLWRLYQELKKIQIDAVADLHNVLRSRILKNYFALDHIPVVYIDKGREEKKALTRFKNKQFQQLKSTHQRYADVFETLGFQINLSKVELLRRKQLSEQVLGLVQLDAKKWIGIAPFAAHEGKKYPLHLIQEVIQALENTSKYKILLFGGGPDETQQLETLSDSYKNTLCMAGKLTLDQELELISNLDVMLSMDSGNAHLAANYGIPVVTLWGVTHPFAGFYPFGQPLTNALLANREQYPLIPTSVYGNKMPKDYGRVMESIPTQKVIDKLIEILEA